MADWQETKAWIETLAATATRRNTTFDGGQLQWHIWGTGPPLILLHGGSGSWTHWCRNIAVLQKYYQVFAPDLPGNGDSDAPPFAFDSLEIYDATQRLAEAVRSGWQQMATDAQRRSIHVMGFSLGSIVATVLAGLEGKCVAQLVVVGTSALDLPFAGLAGKLRPVHDHVSFEQQIADQKHNLGLIMLADHADIDDAGGWLQLQNVKRARLRTHTLARSNVMIKALPRLHRSTDVVAVWGSHDAYAQPTINDCVSRLRELAPKADTCVVEGAGHWVMYEYDDVFNDLIDEIARNQLRNYFS